MANGNQLSSATRWDYDAYAGIPDDGNRHEIIQGEHFVNPAPNLYHQQLSRRIQFQLYSAIELAERGVVINAPVDVQLSDVDIVQPDLVVIGKANAGIMTPTKVNGIPDLLIEILSPSNPDHDLKSKRQAYQRCRVPEYWIVYPDDRRVLRLHLVNDSYAESWFDKRMEFHLPPAVAIDLTAVW